MPCDVPSHGLTVYTYYARMHSRELEFNSVLTVENLTTCNQIWIRKTDHSWVENTGAGDVCDVCQHHGAIYVCEGCSEKFYFSPSITRLHHAAIYNREQVDEMLCDSCWEECVENGIVVYCSSCDDYHHQDEGTHRDDDDDADYVHDYSYKPAPIFRPEIPRIAYTRTSLHRVFNSLPTMPIRNRETREVIAKRELTRYGIEVEFEIPDGDKSAIAQFIHEFDPIESTVFAKHDGSLSYGIELNFHPRSLEAWREFMPTMSDFFFDLREMGARGDVSTAGIHVHANKRGLESPSHLWRMLRFMALNQEAIQTFARRQSSWARFENIDSQALALAFGREYGEHYDALNVGSDTVEFRIFRGSLKSGRVLANLEFIDALSEYTREMSLADVRGGALSWRAFGEFVNAGGYESCAKAITGGTFDD